MACHKDRTCSQFCNLLHLQKNNFKSFGTCTCFPQSSLWKTWRSVGAQIEGCDISQIYVLQMLRFFCTLFLTLALLLSPKCPVGKYANLLQSNFKKTANDILDYTFYACLTLLMEKYNQTTRCCTTLLIIRCQNIFITIFGNFGSSFEFRSLFYCPNDS